MAYFQIANKQADSNRYCFWHFSAGFFEVRKYRELQLGNLAKIRLHLAIWAFWAAEKTVLSSCVNTWLEIARVPRVPGTRRNSEHHLWHPWILRFLILTCTHRAHSHVTCGTLSFKFLTQALKGVLILGQYQIRTTTVWPQQTGIPSGLRPAVHYDRNAKFLSKITKVLTILRKSLCQKKFFLAENENK